MGGAAGSSGGGGGKEEEREAEGRQGRGEGGGEGRGEGGGGGRWITCPVSAEENRTYRSLAPFAATPSGMALRRAIAACSVAHGAATWDSGNREWVHPGRGIQGQGGRPPGHRERWWEHLGQAASAPTSYYFSLHAARPADGRTSSRHRPRPRWHAGRVADRLFDDDEAGEAAATTEEMGQIQTELHVLVQQLKERPKDVFAYEEHWGLTTSIARSISGGTAE